MRKTIYEPAYRTLLDTLRAARRRKGLRQEDVARRLGVARTWVTKAEQGEIRLDALQLVRLARVYGLKASRLVKKIEEGLSAEDGPDPLFLAFGAGGLLAVPGENSVAACWPSAAQGEKINRNALCCARTTRILRCVLRLNAVNGGCTVGARSADRGAPLERIDYGYREDGPENPVNIELSGQKVLIINGSLKRYE